MSELAKRSRLSLSGKKLPFSPLRSRTLKKNQEKEKLIMETIEHMKTSVPLHARQHMVNNHPDIIQYLAQHPEERDEILKPRADENADPAPAGESAARVTLSQSFKKAGKDKELPLPVKPDHVGMLSRPLGPGKDAQWQINETQLINKVLVFHQGGKEIAKIDMNQPHECFIVVPNDYTKYPNMPPHTIMLGLMGNVEMTFLAAPTEEDMRTWISMLQEHAIPKSGK